MDTDDEKRRSRRVGVLRSVKLVFEQTAIDCIVRDVSPTGVRIRLSQDVIVPEQVTLHFQKGEVVSARRRWQRGHQAGFAFERTDSLVEEPQELAGRFLHDDTRRFDQRADAPASRGPLLRRSRAADPGRAGRSWIARTGNRIGRTCRAALTPATRPRDGRRPHARQSPGPPRPVRGRSPRVPPGLRAADLLPQHPPMRRRAHGPESLHDQHAVRSGRPPFIRRAGRCCRGRRAVPAGSRGIRRRPVRPRTGRGRCRAGRGRGAGPGRARRPRCARAAGPASAALGRVLHAQVFSMFQ